MKGRENLSFYNDGFGWACKSCALKLESAVSDRDRARSRLVNEGEAESKQPTLSKIALAKWIDAKRTILCCPHCGIEEAVGE